MKKDTIKWFLLGVSYAVVLVSIIASLAYKEHTGFIFTGVAASMASYLTYKIIKAHRKDGK